MALTDRRNGGAVAFEDSCFCMAWRGVGRLRMALVGWRDWTTQGMDASVYERRRGLISELFLHGCNGTVG